MKRTLSVTLSAVALTAALTVPTSSEAATVNGFAFKPGDILITKSSSSYGLTGHSGIVLPDGKTVLHIQGPGKYATKLTIGQWLSSTKYPKTKVVRSNSSTQAAKAAAWGKKHYLEGKGRYTKYFVDAQPRNLTRTYCSEIVWQSYYYGAGKAYKKSRFVDGIRPRIEWDDRGIMQPYDFTNGVNQTHNGFKTVKSFKW